MTNLPERREMRISDADRDRVAEVLRNAAGEGRLTLEELDERLSAVYSAKTYGDLEPITRDLPDGDAPHPVRSDRVGGEPTSRIAVAVMSRFRRSGGWVVPEELTAVTFWGGGELDLREARFAAPRVTIRAFAIMGGIDVFVPEDVEVHVRGLGIMGAFDGRVSATGAPGAPVIVITGLAFWGGVRVKYRSLKERIRRWLEAGGPRLDGSGRDERAE